MGDKIKWKHELWPIARLKPHEKNPRKLTAKGKKQLQESLGSIGMAQPINIDVDGTILSGHQRYYIEKENKEMNVPVYVPSRKLTEEEQKEVIVRMNKNIAGEWDMQLLEKDFNLNSLTDWGFDKEELSFCVMDEINDDEEELKDDGVKSNSKSTCPECGHVWTDI